MRNVNWNFSKPIVKYDLVLSDQQSNSKDYLHTIT